MLSVALSGINVMNHPRPVGNQRGLFCEVTLTRWENIMTIHTLGINIAKNTFQLHGADKNGKMILKKRLSRRELTAYGCY